MYQLAQEIETMVIKSCHSGNHQKNLKIIEFLFNTILIDHFTDVYSVTWSLNGSEAGGDLVLIQTSLLLSCKSSCSYAN